MAQTDEPAQRREFSDAFMQAEDRQVDSLRRLEALAGLDSLRPAAPAGTLTAEASTGLSLPLTIPDFGLSPYYNGFGGWGFGGYDLPGSSWRLHEGFNAQFSLSMSAAFGRHAPSGVGFGQAAAFAYALPLTDKLTAAAGLYARNMDWGRLHQTDVGFAAMLGYQVNDRINLYAYASTSFLPRSEFKSPMRLAAPSSFDPASPFRLGATDYLMHRRTMPYLWQEPRTRVGAAAEFKIGNNAMIGVSVEHVSY